MRKKPLAAIIACSLVALPIQAVAAKGPVSTPIGTAMAKAASGKRAAAGKGQDEEGTGAVAAGDAAFGGSYLAIGLGALGIAALTAVVTSGGDSGKPVSS